MTMRWVQAGTAVCLAAMLSAAPLRAETPPDLFSCPDSAKVDPRRHLNSDALRLLRDPPRTAGETSADLARQAWLASVSYALYDAYGRGEDPAAALPTALRLVALIYGDPGRNTERRLSSGGRRRDTTTFYGFVADWVGTGERVVVFRGTLQPNEWIRNLQARQRPFPSGLPRWRAPARVHAGFLSIFDTVFLVRDGARRPIRAALPDLVAGRDTTFVGHSLGGALATLAAVEAARLAPRDAARMRVATFASPRVGDPGFAAMARAVGRIDRVCNLVDVVPAVPASIPVAAYTHVGEAFRVSSFDWPALENRNKPPQQIVCWHSISAYAYMVDPTKSAMDLGACGR